MARSSRKTRRKARQLSSGPIRLTRSGYGFVSTVEGEYFIFPSRLNGAMDGDYVEVTWLRNQERQRNRTAARVNGQVTRSANRGNERLGAVVRVLERKHQTLIGLLTERDGLRVVRPSDDRIPYDVFIDNRTISKPAKDGDIVVVRLLTWPSRNTSASGYIEELVGSSEEPDIDIEIICRKHGIRTEFPAAVLVQARACFAATPGKEYAACDSDAAIGSELGSDRLERRDLTDLITFTIDPADAHDFDDALSAEYVDGGFYLGVHIADVSHFVTLDSSLDLEARLRGTSVYLPDRVIPMLPVELSNDLCSLNPGEVRLAMTVMMELDRDGRVLGTEFYPSRIRSAARLNYDQVDAFLTDPDPEAYAIDSEVASRLTVLDRVARRLKARRIARGAIDFDSSEAKVLLDENGKPIDVILRKTTSATSLVEEAMILANEQVAAYMLADKSPMVYRIHDEPTPMSLTEVTDTLYNLRLLKSPTPPATSAEIQMILVSTADKPEHALVSSMLLRAMKRARYASYFSTHYGLASDAYCHFTSPIRRYPDLLVHHLLKMKLAGEKLPVELVNALPLLAEQSSNSEDAAEAATREATNLKLVEYMSGFVDEVFDVMIVSVTNQGLFVREQTTTVEGLIPKDRLPGAFVYDPEAYSYSETHGKRSLTLGQMLRVRLYEADTVKAQLNFEPVWAD